VFTRSQFVATGTAVATFALVAACGVSGDDTSPSSSEGEASALRLGYFPNFTHAPALVGVQDGIFTEHLGDVALETTTFNAGPDVIEALFTGVIDASFIGPNPAINGFAQSDGEALRIVSGSTSGGAFLVVRDGIESVADLEGTTLATPQLGNTQDVALRHWLSEQGYETTLEGAGDVAIAPMANGDTLTAFHSGELDGAFLPEPWASRLVIEAGAHVLLDEADLWPDGRFVTTHLIVSTSFLDENPGVVRDLIAGELAAIDFINENPDQAQVVVNDAIEELTGQRVSDELLTAAWPNVEFTADPVPASLFGSAAHAEEVGLLDPVDLDGIYALDLLNELLVEAGGEPVRVQ
jgi:NitT/TauT family transport system substrate-binding protein